MSQNKILVFMHTVSLLYLRGVERWLLEVASRLKNSIILTFSVGLSNIKDIKSRINEINIRLKESKLRNVEWYELRALSHENMSNLIPKPIVRFMRHSGIIIPIDFRVCRLLRKRITYLVVGDFIQALFLSAIAVVCGAYRIIIGFHSRPNYKRCFYVKPFLELMNRLGLLKGIHTVNIVDALVIRGILHTISVWWISNGVNC